MLPLTASATEDTEDTLTILMGGDVLFDRGVRSAMAQWPTDDAELPAPPSLRQHGEDALVVNLECPITTVQTAVSKQIVFRADTTAADVMVRLGITHAALANNHSVDRGAEGLQHTAHHLRRAGITPFGYGTTSEERLSPTLISKGTAEVAIFNAITFPIENWTGSTVDGKADICHLSADSLAATIRRYHIRYPQRHIVVFLHWGTEFSTSSTFRQHIDAVKLIQAGAAAIVGQHPHVVQPMQLIGQVPVYYSLGNFIFDQKQPACREAIAVRLQFTTQGLIRHESLPLHIVDCLPNFTEDH